MQRMVIILSVVAGVAHIAVADDVGQSISLFDGKSFQGWEGNLDAFRIEDGAIVGGSLTKPVPRNDYLCSKKTYADFELRLKFKVLGEGANAGIQIRSERVANSNEMIGYQADLGDNWWCLLVSCSLLDVANWPESIATRINSPSDLLAGV